jgi:hypothetical protein
VINSSNPAKPVMTLNQAIHAGGKLEITFRTRIRDDQATGAYSNSFIYEFDGKVMSTGALATVNVGGASLGDTVFRDWNGNGVQDDGEEGLPGVTVELWDSTGTTLINSRQTNAA